MAVYFIYTESRRGLVGRWMFFLLQPAPAQVPGDPPLHPADLFAGQLRHPRYLRTAVKHQQPGDLASVLRQVRKRLPDVQPQVELLGAPRAVPQGIKVAVGGVVLDGAVAAAV